MPSTHTEPPRPQRPHGDEHDLYATHHRWLKRALAQRVNTSEPNLEDACSFAWLKLLTNQPRRETVRGWLLTVATHEAYRLHRRDSRDTAADAQPAQSADAGELLSADLIAGLKTLHPRRREMLLKYAAGYTTDEIAAAFDTTPARVRKLIYRARQQLATRTDRGPSPRPRRR